MLMYDEAMLGLDIGWVDVDIYGRDVDHIQANQEEVLVMDIQSGKNQMTCYFSSKAKSH